MSYELEAFLGPTEHLDVVFSRYPGIKVIDLNQEFSIAPVSGELFQLIHDMKPRHEISDYDGNPFISKDTEKFGRLASQDGVLAYVRIFYNGGNGLQLAMAWQNEAVIFELTVDKRHAPPGRDGAVNLALASMGVIAEGDEDEFSALGLGLHRETDEWLE